MAGISAVAAFPTDVVGFNVFVSVPADVGFPAVAGFDRLSIIDYRNRGNTIDVQF
jgi:hypothetical protein